MFFGCCGTRFAQTSSHLIQKTSTILLIFLWRTNEQPYNFMKRWACFSILAVKVAISASSIALFGIILFLSDSNNNQFRLRPEQQFTPANVAKYPVQRVCGVLCDNEDDAPRDTPCYDASHTPPSRAVRQWQWNLR